MVSCLTNGTNRPFGRQCRLYRVAREAVSPLAAAGAVKIRFTQINVFGITRSNKTTDNDGKRNNNVQT